MISKQQRRQFNKSRQYEIMGDIEDFKKSDNKSKYRKPKSDKKGKKILIDCSESDYY